MTGNVSDNGPRTTMRSVEQVGLGCVTRVAGISYFCLDLLALGVRPLESFVIATVFIWDFMLGVFDRSGPIFPSHRFCLFLV